MPIEIHGVCEERFAPLKDAFAANFADGLELGASLGVTYQGRMVVDLWAGWADVEKTRPWAEDTIVQVASTTKIMAIVCALMLIDRGRLELDAPVARYWPEFAAGGKGAVTVRDALSHEAGVPGFSPPQTFDIMGDLDRGAATIAAQDHWFGGRRKVVYHAFTYGFLIGELIRRVDGRTPARFFAEEVAGPSGADFQIGLSSQAERGRLAATRSKAGNYHMPPGTLAARVWESIVDFPSGPPSWTALSFANIGGNGFGNGRAIARVCAILAMGGTLDGLRYTSPELVREAATEQAYGKCPLMGWISMGLGFGLNSNLYPAPSPTAFHWGGAGGSWGVMDARARVSLGYAPNNLIIEDGAPMDPRLQRLSDALGTLLPEL